MKAVIALFVAALVWSTAPAHAEPAYTACPALPAFPGVDCTGPTLAPYTGPLSFRTNGQVIENVEILTDTAIYLPANNVTFRNVRFIYTGPMNATFAVVNNRGTGNVFDKVEIDGRYNVARAITGNGATVRNSNIHSTGNALEISGPMLVEDNYFHGISTPTGQEWHADGIQSGNTGTANDGITIRHNTIIMDDKDVGSNAVIWIPVAAGDTAKNNLIENNLFAGGNWTMSTSNGENFQILNNRFSTRVWPKVGQYGIWYPYAASVPQGITRSGNVIAETGAPADS